MKYNETLSLIRSLKSEADSLLSSFSKNPNISVQAQDSLGKLVDIVNDTLASFNREREDTKNGYTTSSPLVMPGSIVYEVHDSSITLWEVVKLSLSGYVNVSTPQGVFDFTYDCRLIKNEFGGCPLKSFTERDFTAGTMFKDFDTAKNELFKILSAGDKKHGN